MGQLPLLMLVQTHVHMHTRAHGCMKNLALRKRPNLGEPRYTAVVLQAPNHYIQLEDTNVAHVH